MGKLSFLAGAAVGYVLGARAGRARYEQIRTQASRLWSSEPVQTRVGDAAELVKAQAAPFVIDKLGDAAKSVGQVLRERRDGERLPEDQRESGYRDTEQLPAYGHPGTGRGVRPAARAAALLLGSLGRLPSHGG